ncbi:MFS transporter [Neobacillus niacini]|uniref:MFS transporter n=1 Tax=Neobacillus niacini TaxID=86668 RepID=UPI0030004290
MQNKMTKNPWFVILFSGLFYWLAHSLTRPLIALYAQSLGISEVKIGFIVGIYAVLPFLLAIASGGMADSIGRVKVLRIGTILMLVSGIFYMIATNIYLLMIAQIIAGLGQMTVWLVIQVLITDSNQNQAERIASFTVYNTIGQMMGPLIGGFLAEKYSMNISFGVYTAFSVLLVLLAFQLKEPATNRIDSGTYSIKDMYTKSFALLKNREIIATLLCTFIALFILDVRMTFLPIYLQDIGISPFKIGILISLGTSTALFIKPIYPVLIRVLGIKTLLILTFAISLSLLFITPLINHFYSFVLLLVFSGIALGINQPLSLSMISEQTSSNERGIAVGLRLMANRLAQFMDPILFGILTAVIGIKLTFILIGLLLLLLSVVTISLLQVKERKRKVPSLKEKVL